MQNKRNVLITGANGFVGSWLLSSIGSAGYIPRPVARQHLPASEATVIDSIDSRTDWQKALQGCTKVVHLAARVHVMNDGLTYPLATYRETNVEGTLNFARQAAAMGVKRFVYLSSIKVNGEITYPGKPFLPDDVPAPQDPYGESKWEAEQGLFAIARETGIEVVCIRPPLVFGPGVKANFLSMMRWLQRGIPLPLAGIRNLRSLVALPNLVDLIVTCLDHPKAANQVFLVSDGDDLATPDLLRRTAAAMGKQARLFAVPPSLLETAGCWLGKGEVVQRLCGSLQVDIRKTRELLDWMPPVSVDQALRDTVAHFLAADPEHSSLRRP